MSRVFSIGLFTWSCTCTCSALARVAYVITLYYLSLYNKRYEYLPMYLRRLESCVSFLKIVCFGLTILCRIASERDGWNRDIMVISFDPGVGHVGSWQM